MALKEEMEQQGNWLFRYRSILPVGILVLALIIFIEMKLKQSPLSACDYVFESFCLLISLAGLLIRAYTVGYSPKNTSGRNTAQGQVADTLNTTGIYSVVRNPLYLGNFFMWLGLALLTENVWFVISFILLYWMYYERIIFAEEQFLERKFGDQYTEWAKRVPVFIPNFNKFSKPDIKFNIIKVLLKEKNGFFALFLLFSFFNVIEEYIRKHTHYNMVFITGFLIAMVSYLVLKWLKVNMSNEN
ncbi:methyltransferase family protein [Sphingobacterium spiritivorum]|uniref:methyltransferase family protein n=1 Tax=Sphingobacterium spiritivorum TaxID=258 RepID=UPI003DA3F0AD